MSHWDFGRPYLIDHDSDGYCVHLDRETCKCAVHENRPAPYRGFDCTDNARWQVWVDYEKKIINRDLIERINKGNGGNLVLERQAKTAFLFVQRAGDGILT